MSDDERQTQSHLTRLLARHGIHPRHDLGQNFLIDLNLVEFIVAQAELEPSDAVLEIGPGTGSMTSLMARQAGDVIAVDIDPNMCRLASEATSPFPNVTVLNLDALQNKNTLAPEILQTVHEKLGQGTDRRLKLVANLPYNVATPVISNLAATELPWERMVVTIQLELAERMAARPGTRDYSALSVWLQAQCRVEILRTLKPSVFWPRPKVNSAVVLIRPDPVGRDRIRDRAFFLEFVRRVFQQRRKHLRGVVVAMFRQELQKADVDAILQELGLGEQSRVEALDSAILIELSNRIKGALGSQLSANRRAES